MRVPHKLVMTVAVAALVASGAAGDIITATLKFTRASELLGQADRARDENDRANALALYKRALNSFAEVFNEDPDFQPEMVQFRMEYCDSQMAALLDELHPGDDQPVQATNSTPATAVEDVMALDAALPGAEPESIRELLAVARRQIEEGEPEAAREQLMKGFKIDPDNADLRLLAGLAQCQARKFDDAVFLLGELVGEQPSNAPVRVGLAAAYFGAGQVAAARRELETALTLEPDLKDAHYDMAQVLLADPEPDIETAARHYRRARELGAAPDLRIENAIEKKED